MSPRTIIVGAIAAGAALSTAGAVISARLPPPEPSGVQISNVNVGTKRASFDVQWTPGRSDPKTPYPNYQISIAPKFACKIAGTAPGAGGFATASFAAAPYKVSVECDCNHPYTASVASAPVDAYSPRSKWIASSRVMMACQKP